jgi:hypothetical protein
MGMGGQRHAPAALPAGNTRYSLCRRLGRTQGLSGRMRRTSPTPEFDPWTIQPVEKTQYVQPPPNIVFLKSLTAWREYQTQNVTR